MTKQPNFLKLAFLLSLCLCSCSAGPSELSASKYVDWIATSSGLIKEKSIGDFTFKVFYKPAEYIAHKENLISGSAGNEELEKRISGLSKQFNFSFKIVSKSGFHPLNESNYSEEEYFEKLHYYLAQAKSDFKLIIPKLDDTLSCNLYHFERNYGSAPFLDISLAFQNPLGSELEDIVFVYEDQIFNNGKIQFSYEKEEIQELPAIR